MAIKVAHKQTCLAVYLRAARQQKSFTTFRKLILNYSRRKDGQL